MPLTLSIQSTERYALASGFCRVYAVPEAPEASAYGSVQKAPPYKEGGG